VKAAEDKALELVGASQTEFEGDEETLNEDTEGAW